LWLALRRGSVTINYRETTTLGWLWLALRRGSVTIVGLQALCFQGLADKKC